MRENLTSPLNRIQQHGKCGRTQSSLAEPEAAIGGFKQVIGDGLRSRTDQRRATEADGAVLALNRMLEFGPRSPSASPDQKQRSGNCARVSGPCNTALCLTRKLVNPNLFVMSDYVRHYEHIRLLALDAPPEREAL